MKNIKVCFEINVETEDEAQAMIDKVHESLPNLPLNSWYEKPQLPVPHNIKET